MIELNKVGIEIDGKVYKMRKMTFSFQRRMIALQTSINDTQKRLAKKYDVSTDKLDGVITAEEPFVVGLVFGYLQRSKSLASATSHNEFASLMIF